MPRKETAMKWLISYFKSCLFGLLDYRAKASSTLFRVEASRFGGIESVTPKKIELTKEQCAEIVNPIHPFRWAMLDGDVQLRF